MAVLTGLAIAAGIGSMAVGAYNMYEGQQRAAEGAKLQQQGSEIQAQAARQQAEISKEQAASSVVFAGKERDVNVLASQQSIDASNQSYGINQNVIAAQQEIEAQKAKAMEIDARRQQTEIIRNQQRGRALALTNATAQGAARGSGLQGGYGQIAGVSGFNMLGVQQNLQIGRDIYSENQNISNSRIQQADLEHMYALQQANNQTTKANTAYDYAVVNAGYTTRFADTQTLNSQGAGLVNRGAGVASQGQMQASMGQSLFSAGPSIFSMGSNFNQLAGSSFGSGGFGPGSVFMGGFAPTGYGSYRGI